MISLSIVCNCGVCLYLLNILFIKCCIESNSFRNQTLLGYCRLFLFSCHYSSVLSVFLTISCLLGIHARTESSKCTIAEQILLKAVSSTSREVYFIFKRQQKFLSLCIIKIKRHIAKPKWSINLWWWACASLSTQELCGCECSRDHSLLCTNLGLLQWHF